MDDLRLNNESLPEEPGSEAVVRSARKSSGSNSTEWLVNVEDDVVVPMVTSEIVEAFRAGRVTQRSLVWRIGMHDWSALAEVPQLRLAVGPSPLPAAASTPGPIVYAASAAVRDQPRRGTLPFGFPAARDVSSVREPSGLGPGAVVPAKPSSAPLAEDGEAIAVYERPAASLTFAESMREEWHGRESSPAIGAARLTPVQPASSRLSGRGAHSVAPNTLSPTTAEAEAARRLGAYGDKSVVFASELRAAKKTSKRIALWAALGSAAVASIATFLIARAASQPSDQVTVSPAAAAVVHEAPAVPVAEPEASPTLANSPPAASAPLAPAANKKPTLRAFKRAAPVRPAPVRVAPAAQTDSDPASPAALGDDNAGDTKPSVAASLSAAAPAPSDSAPSNSAPSNSAPSNSAPSAVPPAASATPSAEHLSPTLGF